LPGRAAQSMGTVALPETFKPLGVRFGCFLLSGTFRSPDWMCDSIF
jgi:hypothetical protein